MSFHITHIPLLYCLLYYRTDSGRARDIFLSSGIIATDSRFTDVDSIDEIFFKDSSYYDESSRLESEEEKDWDHMHLPYKNKHKSRKHLRDSILNLLPWRQLRRDFSFEHRPHQRHKRHRHTETLCSNNEFRTEHTTRSHRNGFKQTTRWSAPPFRNDAERQYNKQCSLRTEADVKDLLPGVFMSHQELVAIVPPHGDYKFDHETLGKVLRQQLIVKSTKLSDMVKPSQKHHSLRSNSLSSCGACFTDIAYDVFQEITDVNGIVHQVINFNNAFQFIPVGRCKNEFSECGGGQGAICRQVYRAHWSFVFSQQTGAQLVPHEVPSHCECTNIATATVGEMGKGQPKSADAEATGIANRGL